MATSNRSAKPMVDVQATRSETQLYDRSLFDKELRDSRKLLLKILVLPLTYTTLLMWACLSLYWGSTTSDSLHKLTTYAVNMDDGAFGQQMIKGVETSLKMSGNSLGWRFDDTIHLDASSRKLVTDEQAWAVVQSPSPLLLS